ncbi:DNA-3-methyladenine glycosylase II [Bacillus cereus]|nr:DNA-3-methyladenine glycosylase II [Bacillus cereus]
MIQFAAKSFISFLVGLLSEPVIYLIALCKPTSSIGKAEGNRKQRIKT